jgi:hypothetical protein
LSGHHSNPLKHSAFALCPTFAWACAALSLPSGSQTSKHPLKHSAFGLCLRALPSGSAFGLCLRALPSGSAFGLCLRALKHSNILSCGSVIDLSLDHEPACQATTATLSNILPSGSVQRSLGRVLRCLCLRALKHSNILSNILPSGSAFGLCLRALPLGSAFGLRLRALPSGSAFGLCLRALPAGSQTYSNIVYHLTPALGVAVLLRARCLWCFLDFACYCVWGSRLLLAPSFSILVPGALPYTSAWCLTLGWPRQTLVVCLWCPRVSFLAALRRVGVARL